MLQSKIVYEKQCAMCKVVSGGLFAGMGAFHTFRMQNLWRFYGAREKAFNVIGLFVLGSISVLNFNAAYQIKMGRAMDNIQVQTRESYSSRIGEAVGWMRMSEEEKLNVIKEQIKHEEDKDFVNKTVK